MAIVGARTKDPIAAGIEHVCFHVTKAMGIMKDNQFLIMPVMGDSTGLEVIENIMAASERSQHDKTE